MITLLLLACADDDDITPGAGETSDTTFVESACAATWPADDCAEGCAPDPVGSRWEATLIPAVAEELGVAPHALAGRVRMRNVGPAPTFTSNTRADWQIDLDWVRVVVRTQVWVDSPTGFTSTSAEPDFTDGQLIAAWRERLFLEPSTLGHAILPLEDAQAFVADCAAELDVDFPTEGWCSADPRDLNLQFSAPLEGSESARAVVSLTDRLDSLCQVLEPVY